VAEQITNVVVAGLGGQGVLKASDILAEAAFRAGRDVKKAEVHGMSQRGGSVTSDVRFAADLSGASPMVPAGSADYLLVLSMDQVEVARPRLSDDGVLISADWIDENALPNRKSLNVAVLGALSTYLDLDEDVWRSAVHANLPEKVHEVNDQAFALGREAARKRS